MVATRDRITPEAAAAYVEETALLAARARSERDALPDPPPLVAPDRRAFLERGALARLWMQESFEPAHQAEDISANDPLLTRALASAKHVRPELYMLCQLVAVPSGFDDDREGLFAKAKDPDWQATARARIDTVSARMKRYVRVEDPQACQLMAKLLRFETRDDGQVTLSVESKAFDLDACAETASDGSCAQPQWAPEWVDAVRPHHEPGFLPTFETRFGYHVVFLVDVLEAASADDPDVQAAVREAILDPWRATALDAELDALRKRWAVRVVTGDGA